MFGVTPVSSRRLVNAANIEITPAFCRRQTENAGSREHAVLTYTGCRAGELVRFKAGHFRLYGPFHLPEIYGKGGEERVVWVHPDDVHRLFN